jgi:adenine-specific DNA-methyltransferase
MIRSELDVLLDKVQDPALRADLRSQIDRLKQRRSFGLVFEQHIPERVRLPQHPIRAGSQVVSRDDDDSPTFEVILIDDGVATLVQVRDADGAYVGRSEHGLGQQERAPVDSLVVISDFGEPVLPGFRHLGSVERGGDKPYHVVINGENHHALEALRFTHAGKVDCIYIDPPYNSGARDWKYNNDYVDDTDAYRHSKWLAFMERRLKLAKELLNPDDSVLIVTIDEKEYLRLGLLLEQTFSSGRVQMVTTVVNRKGIPRSREFARVDEYIFFVFLGDAGPLTLSNDMLSDPRPTVSEGERVGWLGLRRRGSGWRRTDRPGSFYPIFVNATAGRIVDVGEPIPAGASRSSVADRDGCITVWPFNSDGVESRWQLSPAMVRRLLAEGMLRSSLRGNGEGVAIDYLSAGQRAQIQSGDIVVHGRDPDGALVVRHAGAKRQQAKSVWNLDSHGATAYGTQLLTTLLPGRRFPYPKSLYAVEDTIRFFVKDKPNAVVLDFFAGSGTSAHAVARLNRQDGGRRQCILVTNNEVSVDEAKELRSHGLRPGDPEWEALGVFEHITRPRVTASITGKTPDGKPIAGDYKFADEFPMADGFEENVAFLELRYLDADDIDLGQAFDDIAPLLWLRAGGQGPIAPRVDHAGWPLPYVWTDRYGVLFDEDRWRSFVSARPETARTAFIVTYSPTVFAGIAAELPTSMDTLRLYDTYLSMFLPERGRA